MSPPDVDPIRILLLEDNSDDAALVAHLLRQRGVRAQFEMVPDEVHFLACLDARPPDVVIADYALRGYTGIAALEELRRRRLAIPFILVTGALTDEVAEQCIRLGAADYILKDRLARLPEAVQRALDEKKLRDERERAVAALRTSEEAYRLLFERNPHPMWVYDLETLRFLAVNRVAVEHYGYTAPEFLDMTLADIRPSSEVPRLLEFVRDARTGCAIPVTVIHRTKAGKLIDVHISSSRLQFHGRDAELVLAEDVTERQHFFEQICRSESQFRSLVDNAPFGIYRTRADCDHFLLVNPALVQMLGWPSAEDLMRATVSRDVYCHPGDRERIVERRKRGPERDESEVEWKRKDGTPVLVRLLGRRLPEKEDGAEVFEVIAEDVTERRQMQEALRVSEERLRMTIAAGNVGVWEWELADDRVWFYPEHDIIFGYEQLPRWSYPLFMQHVLEEDRTLIARVVAEGKRNGAFQVEFRARSLDGALHWLASKGMVEYDAARVPVRMRGTIEDITERRTIEEQLRQALKMEAIGRLAGGIAHDFNNLLMVMRGFAELLHEKVTAPQERHHTEKILESADRAARLIGQLLAFSRKQVLAPQVLNLNECVAEVGKLLPRVLGEHIEVVLKPHPGLHSIKADPIQVEQVLMNLAINARDAMPKGGKLIIETHDAIMDDAHARRHAEATPGPYVLLAVSDTGCGMDPETSQHIFEPFFTTKREHGGTGLGLATVYGIVRQSGGFVWVYSEIGKGTTFKIYLPAVAAHATPLSKLPPAATTAGGHETLLVVEDEDGVREAMTEYLRRRGYNVLAAGNGADALHLAGNFEGAIDLLVTDVVMPAMGGPELARALAARRPETRVLYVSGFTGSVLAEQLELDGATAFLEKPFTWEAFARKVREVLEHAAEPMELAAAH
jgi:PAS domain S-box-containing protein